MSSQMRRLRQKVREHSARVAGPTAMARGAIVRPEMPNGWIFYGRADTYGGGGKYQGGRAEYGCSRYGVGATYGYAVRTATTALYGYSFYGRNHVYGS